MASGTKRQLCAVLVLRRRGSRIRQSGTVEFGICVLTAMKLSEPPLEWAVAPDHFLSTDFVETLDAKQLLAVISTKFRIEQNHLIANLCVTVRMLTTTNA